MENLLIHLNQYWGLAVAFLFGVGYVLTHRQISISYVKTIIPKLMIAAEKQAEKLILINGQDKLNWVVNEGYNYLPSWVRLIISKPLFAIIAQKLFDEAIAYARTHSTTDIKKEYTSENMSQ